MNFSGISPDGKMRDSRFVVVHVPCDLPPHISPAVAGGRRPIERQYHIKDGE